MGEKKGMYKDANIAFEDSLSDEWGSDLETIEVPLGTRPFLYVGIVVTIVAVVFAFQIILLAFGRGNLYADRAQANLSSVDKIPAPRGLIYDRAGQVVADNKAVFLVFLKTKEFLANDTAKAETLTALHDVLGLTADDISAFMNGQKGAGDVLLAEGISQKELIALQGLSLPTLAFQNGYERDYPGGPAFSSLLGYTGLPTGDDLKADRTFTAGDIIGKAGLELLYDKNVRGEAGTIAQYRDAKGNLLDRENKKDPAIGNPLHLTIDSEFQKYFYDSLMNRMHQLGLKTGAGIAIDPRSGQVLALFNAPGYDNNLFAAPGNNAEKRAELTDPRQLFFNRAIAGLYTPGSTIKLLDSVAILKDGILDPSRQIFSPGYLDIPNPYNPAKPTRYLDWRYQGNVNLSAAIAQSSDVYFYETIGGAEGIKGLGINRLREWWQKFGLGSPTGIDLPGEAKGFLPSADWKQQHFNTPWLLGDTFNVAIGQGDVLLTPLQILNTVVPIANGGVMYTPTVINDGSTPKVSRSLADLLPEIQEVQKGMRQTVTSPMGTAYLLHDLPFYVGAKTGSAQVENNTQENAFFVGYAAKSQADAPEIAILILMEHSKEGSLNTIPVARDILNWYYQNRMTKG